MFYSTDYLSYLFLGIGLINKVDRLLTELFVLSSHRLWAPGPTLKISKSGSHEIENHTTTLVFTKQSYILFQPT